MATEVMCVKATLSSGKTVLIREMTIDDTEKCAEKVASRAGDSAALLNVLTQKELIKTLIVKIDDHVLKLADKENLKAFLNMQEYGEVVRAVSKMVGAESKEASIELVAFAL
jgi:hypothetical protein